MTQTPVQSLQGQFLLAMPSMGDPRFLRSVVYMVAHDSEGAMGFIINKRAEGLSLGDILKDMPETVAKTGLVNLPVYVGGPVQNDRGFVLHTSDYEKTHNTLSQELPIALTQSADVLVDAAHGRGPEKMRLFLGYAGWGPGQIEGELQDNAWLVCDANIAEIFTSQSDDLYEKCVAAMGIDLALLSNEGGEA
ncbi:MAG: YqgE/AlgH family protein [Pseudomonadota bacterium]|jgi:putative transcriptional regulator|nr:YqgE/AlgH family protein [Pseudomonadota bacterium]MEC8585973.1 YqgE/AlgH family protein [Pseudomonadota bacterium]